MQIKDRFKQHYYLFFILTVSLLPRLYRFGSPLLDMHSWRQCDTAAISRNFYRNGFDFFHPQIDWAGLSPGYVGTEFPLYEFLVALLYIPFGVHEFLGRAIAVGSGLGSILLLFVMVRRLFDFETALLSGLFFALLPLNIFYSRTFMPESMMIFFSLLALERISKWLKEGNRLNLLMAIAAGALAFLIKIPIAIILLPMTVLLLQGRKKGYITILGIAATIVIMLLPAFFWYQHAFGISKQHYPFHMFGADLWSTQDIFGFINPSIVFGKWFYKLMLKRMLGIIFTPVGFFLILLGLWPALKTAAWKFLYSWGAALMVYLIIVSNGNVVHEYYQLPFTPLGAVLMAIGARFVFREFSHEISITSHLILVAIIVVIALPGWSSLRKNYKLDFAQLKAAEAVKRFATDSVPIITIDGTNPVLLYYSDRKGWAFPLKHINNYREDNCWDPMVLDELSKQGARYLVITLLGQYKLHSDLVMYVNSKWRLLKETKDFLLYKR